MDVVCKPSDFYRLAFELVANASQVGIEFGFDGLIYQRLPIFGAEDEVDIIFTSDWPMAIIPGLCPGVANIAPSGLMFYLIT